MGDGVEFFAERCISFEEISKRSRLRGKEYSEVKAQLAHILPPEASPALQHRIIHETLNNPNLMPKVSREN
jgi:hypothetical protein